MTVEECITNIRNEVNDETEEYTDSQLIRYINSSIQKASMVLIANNSYMMTEEDEVKTGQIMPNNFVRFAGNFPLRMKGRAVELFNEKDSPLKVKYFITKPTISTKFDLLPFDHEAIIQFIIEASSIMALNHNEFEISQDNAIQTVLQEMVGAICNG